MPPTPTPADVVERRWDTGGLNQVWVAGITYLRTWEGWLYLASVIDAHSRRVVGWAIADHMRADLVEGALRMAIVLPGDLPDTVSSTPIGAPVRLEADHRARGRERPDPIHGIRRGLLGQRDGGVVLRDS